jgi:hypothetical protein
MSNPGCKECEYKRINSDQNLFCYMHKNERPDCKMYRDSYNQTIRWKSVVATIVAKANFGTSIVAG